MTIRDRIKELRRVPASDLVPHPLNWRTHPEGQRAVLNGMLKEIGIANAVIARELADGRLQLIDGHLRTETLPGEMIPVLVLDVTEEEAGKLLLTLDPIAGLAKASKDDLEALMETVQIDDEAVQEMIGKLAVDAGLYAGPTVTDHSSAEAGEDPYASAYVDFRFGSHGGKVSRSVYENFIEAFKLTQEAGNAVTLDDVLKEWLNV